MKYLSLFIFSLIAFFPVCECQAVKYFPSEPGPEFIYDSGPLEILVSTPNHFTRLTYHGPTWVSYNVYFQDPSGDIFFELNGFTNSSMPDPDAQYFEPYVKYLDFPLEDSKTWSSTAVYSEIMGDPIDTVTLTGTVQGSATVTVPAGEFEVKVVSLEYSFHTKPWMNRTEELWLHPQLGPVNNLISWTGIVSTEVSSWDSIKSLYR